MNTLVIQSKKTKKKFDKTFKQHAVDLWLNSGKAATEVAAELGIHAQRLSAWRKRVAGARPPQGGKGAAARSAAPNNWRPKIPACGARMTTCANSGIF
jgi:transposase-like protein